MIKVIRTDCKTLIYSARRRVLGLADYSMCYLGQIVMDYQDHIVFLKTSMAIGLTMKEIETITKEMKLLQKRMGK